MISLCSMQATIVSEVDRELCYDINILKAEWLSCVGGFQISREVVCAREAAEPCQISVFGRSSSTAFLTKNYPTSYMISSYLVSDHFILLPRKFKDTFLFAFFRKLAVDEVKFIIYQDQTLSF